MFDKALFEALCDKYNVERTSEFSKPMLDVDGKVFPITQENARMLFNILEAYNRRKNNGIKV